MKSYQKLWKYANKIIPGGNGLLSKRPQRFSPDLWPTYYTKAKDSERTALFLFLMEMPQIQNFQ